MDRNRAPDGGWGWAIVIGHGILLVVSTAPLPLFGLIFGKTLEDFNCTTKDVTSVVSSHSCCFGLAVLSSPYFIDKFSLRRVGMAGAFILFSGNLIAAFAKSFFQLLMGFGILNGIIFTIIMANATLLKQQLSPNTVSGIGFGFMSVSTVINFNQYFDKKRTIAMGLTQMLNMGGTTLYPLIVETLLVQYGYFGTHLIVAALSAHAIFSTSLIKPVECYRVINNHQKFETSTKEYNVLEDLDLGRKLKNEPINLPGRNIFWWKKVAGSRYITLLKDPKCLNMCLGVAVTTFIDPTFFAMHTVYILGPLGMPIADAKVILTATSAGDLLARTSTMVFGKWLSTKNRSLFWIAMSGTAIGVIGFAFVEDYIAILSFSILLGYFRGIIWVTMNLVFAEHYNTDDFPIVYSLATGIYTVVNLIFGPLIGMIPDYTNSFLVMFMVMAGVLIVTSVFWIVELIVFRFFKKC